MSAPEYVPDRGDLSILRMDEQWRSVLVLSPKAYNEKVGLALCCPIVVEPKGYPFEVLLTEKSAPTAWVALADRVASVDWKGRQARYGGSIGEPFLSEALGKLGALLSQD